jgi:hypothetical protein
MAGAGRTLCCGDLLRSVQAASPVFFCAEGSTDRCSCMLGSGGQPPCSAVGACHKGADVDSCKAPFIPAAGGLL